MEKKTANSVSFNHSVGSKTLKPGLTSQRPSLSLNEHLKHPKILPSFEPFTSQSTQPTVTSMFQGAHDFNISGNPHFVNIGKQHNVNHYSGIHGLDLLKEFVSFNALHDSSAQDPERRCYPGTRETVLSELRAWVDNPNAPKRIFWLHGPAGVGKSAIAQTISQLYPRDKVPATFFFFRSDPTRNDGNRLFPTIAWQLAISIPDIKYYISCSLNENPDLARKTVEIQFEQLIFRPFRAMVEASQELALAPVVVIDGIDECADTGLQRRILALLGKAVAEDRTPLRFMISSRPEAHIREVLGQFQYTTLQVDLANMDEAYRDIWIYLNAEFTRIALEQDIDPETWPQQGVIDDFVLKSSGQFVYASTIIKFVNDDFSSAISQLDIAMGLRASDGRSPFADLDTLYIEILQRQPHQNFLKEVLAILVACIDQTRYNNKDDSALLLNVDKRDLRRKLRGMHSLLKFDPYIDAHHQSFLDFLQDKSRSCQYYVNKKNAEKQYLKMVTEALIRHAYKVIRNPGYHGAEHFAPAFVHAMRKYPRALQIPLGDWEGILCPLLCLREEMLTMPNTKSPWKRGFCDDCNAFYVIDDLLLHLMLFRSAPVAVPSANDVAPGEIRAEGCQCNNALERERELPDQSSPQYSAPTSLSRKNDMTKSTTSKNCDVIEVAPRIGEVQRFSEDDIDVFLLVFLSELRNEGPGVVSIDLMHTLLRLDRAEIASRLRSVSDAHNLVNLIHNLIRNKSFHDSWGQNITDNATRLALEIYARIPLFPEPLFLDEQEVEFHNDDGNKGKYQGKLAQIWPSHGSGISAMYQAAFIWGNLYHGNIPPLTGICEVGSPPNFTLVFRFSENGTLREWRQRCNPSSAQIEQRMLEVARVIQYTHSLGIILSTIYGEQIFVSSDFQAKVPALGLCMRGLREKPLEYLGLLGSVQLENRSYESNVYQFGCLFYEIHFDENLIFLDSRVHFPERPREREISDRAWRLIQHCCRDDWKSLPTISEVVEEMESWRSLESISYQSYCRD